MHSKRILLYDCLFYKTEKRLNRVYITNSVSTTLFIIQSHRHWQASLITKERLNAAGRSNKIAADNGVPE